MISGLQKGYSMSWPRAFRNFNPFDETQYPGWGIDLIIDRAIRSLRHRTMKELEYGLETLHTLELKYNTHGLMKAINKEGNKDKKHLYITHADNLREAMKDFDINDQSEFPEATWPEYFALLALAHIGEYVSTIKEHHPGIDISVLNPELGHNYVDVAVEAMDALGEADALEREKRVRLETLKEGRKAGASHAAKQRLAPYHSVRIKCLKIYDDKYSSRSNRDAAHRIFKNDLTEEERSVFHSDDPAHQIEKWIGDHRKSKDTE